MEKPDHHPSTDEHDYLLRDGYEAVPRDGPALFVTNERWLEEYRCLNGIWICLDQTGTEIEARLDEFHLDPDELIVWDQIRVGEVMVDEQLGIDGLLKRLHRGAQP